MNADPNNPYLEQATRYACREVAGTDLLAFRAVAERGMLSSLRVLDLGCGAGRSTRFLRALGNDVVGVDVSVEMIGEARRLDPAGDYRLISRGLPFGAGEFDAFFSSWMLLELGDLNEMRAILTEAARVLKAGGIGIVITTTPEFYAGAWSTCRVDFPENQAPLRSGQKVRVRLLPEGVELVDFFWSDADYQRVFADAGLTLGETERPLGRAGDRFAETDERTRAPSVIYYLRKSG